MLSFTVGPGGDAVVLEQKLDVVVGGRYRVCLKGRFDEKSGAEGNVEVVVAGQVVVSRAAMTTGGGKKDSWRKRLREGEEWVVVGEVVAQERNPLLEVVVGGGRAVGDKGFGFELAGVGVELVTGV